MDPHPVAGRLAVLAGLRLGQGAPGFFPRPEYIAALAAAARAPAGKAGVTTLVTAQRLGSLLRPRSVALVGAADKSGFSRVVYRNLVDFGLGEHTTW